MRFLERPVSVYQDSYVNFYVDVYKQRWYWKGTSYRISSGVMQETSSVLPKRLHSDLLSEEEALGTHKNKLSARKKDLSNQPQLMRVTPIALLCSWVLQLIEV